MNQLNCVFCNQPLINSSFAKSEMVVSLKCSYCLKSIWIEKDDYIDFILKRDRLQESLKKFDCYD